MDMFLWEENFCKIKPFKLYISLIYFGEESGSTGDLSFFMNNSADREQNINITGYV